MVERPAVTSRTAERAFTLIEVLVVLFIIAILMTIGIWSLKSSRDTGGRLEVRGAAGRYMDAVERYQADHGRQVPVLGGADWPTAKATAGPVKRLEAGSLVVRPYLRADIPEVMTRGGAAGAKITKVAPAPGTPGGALVYVTTSPYQARIDVYWNGKKSCATGDVPTGTPAC